jgi:lipopolysaccharide transport system permease protein
MYRKLKELWHHQELLFSLTMREIKVRYKQTILGALWAIIQPLCLMFVFTIIFSKFAKLPSDGMPYSIFSYCALLPWTFFSTSLSFAMPSLVNNADLVSKIHFPREVLPLSSVMVAIIDFFVSALIFILMMIIYKIPATIYALYVVPLFAVQVIFTVAVALFISAFNACYRDVRYALPLVIQVWMFVSPVIYPDSIIPENLRFFYMLNPMAPVISGYRRVLLHGVAPDLYSLRIAFFISVVLAVLAYAYFKRIEIRLADII